MGRKVYEIKRITYLSTDVTVDGRKIPVVFEGGSRNNPVVVRARFVTDNEGVQKEIEKRKDFGTEILLTYTEEPAPEKQPVVIPDGFTDVKGITTGVEAREYILEHFPEVKHAELKSNPMIKEVAAKNMIIFSELI